MKKFLALLLMSMFAVALVACDGTLTTDLLTTEVPTTEAPTTEAPTTEAPTTEAPTTEAPTTEAPTTEAPTTEAPTTGDTTVPVLTGVDDVEIFLNTVFDPLEGVSAIDNVDGDITDQIEVSGLSLLDTSKTGQYFLSYSIEDSSGNISEKTRYVTVVIDPTSIGDEMVQNGDFSLGAGIWTIGEYEGGIGDFSVVDGVGVLDVTPGWSETPPRLQSNVMDFENGQTYQVTFSAKADAARPIMVQVGEVLPASPWFVNYMPIRGAIVFDLTTEWEPFTFKFTMNQDDADGTILPGQLLFGHGGTIESDIVYPEANYTTVVYYDDVVIVESTPDPDTEAPTISGVRDLTLEVGTTYDPLAGVTALDVVDGEITLDATNYTSDVDTSTSGEYTVVYTVTDEAGNTATETITVTVVELVFEPTTEVVDGTFTTTTEITAEVQDTEENGYADITPEDIWYYYLAGWDGAAATFSITDKAAVIDITATGGHNWGVMLKQKGLSLVQGETYKLSFTASATADRDIVATVTGKYFEVFNLTSTATEFSFMFTYEESDRTDGIVEFLLGNTANFAAGAVTIDDVVLSQLVQEDLVTNANFDNDGWNIWFQDWDEGNGIADASYEIVNGELVVTIGALGDHNYSIQVFQEGIQVAEGTEYTITFDAKADVARDINLKFIDADDMEFVYVASLTTEMQTFTYTFTYNGTAASGKIDFELGVIGDATTGVVTFDNVAMTDGTDPLNLVNGDFEQVLGWGLHSDDGATTFTQVDGELVVTVPSVGVNPWDVQVFQNDIDLFDGAGYTIVFTAKSDVARDINYKIMTPGYVVRENETVSLTTEMQTFVFSFIYDGTDPLGQINFELGAIGDATGGTVTFGSVLFFRNFNTIEDINDDEPVVDDGDHVYQETDGWRAFINDWEGGAGELNVIDGELVLEMTGINAYQAWTVQVIQDAFALGTGEDNVGSMLFEAGKTYRVTFDAKASIAGDINLAIGHAGGGWTEYYLEVVSITTEMTTYTVEFTLDDTEMDYTTLAQLKFELGNLLNGQEAPQSFVLDNVIIEEKDGETYTDTGLVVNGDMSEGAEIIEGQETLVTPFGLVINDGVLAWGAMENVSSFEVYVDGVTGSPFTVAAGTYNYNLADLDLAAGTYSVTLKAIGDGVVYLDSAISAVVDYTVVDGPTQLQTPFGIVINTEGLLQWGAMPNASSFEVYVDGVTGSPFTVAAGTYSFDLTTLSLAAGTYDITIKAIGDDVDYTDSVVSGVVQFTVTE